MEYIIDAAFLNVCFPTRKHECGVEQKKLKEITVLNLTSNAPTHWVIRQKKSKGKARHICGKGRKPNHGLALQDGECCEFTVQKVLKDILKSCKRVYVRNIETYLYLDQQTSGKVKFIRNLDNWKNLPDPGKLCIRHELLKPGNVCTMNNVYKVQSWFSQNTVVASFSHEIVPIKCKKKRSINLDILHARPDLTVHVQPVEVQSEWSSTEVNLTTSRHTWRMTMKKVLKVY